MRARKLPITVLAAFDSLLAGGCCCPRLSGRYYEVGCRPPCRAPAPIVGGGPAIPTRQLAGCDPWSLKGGHGHAAWHGLLARAGGAPSQQGPDYVSPQPKFHPA